MATTAFGDPQYAEPDPQEQQEQLAPIDPNDPRLTSEDLIEDPSKSAYAQPAPPPDGKWNAKLKQIDIKDKADGQMKKHIAFLHPKMNDGRPMFVANVEASLIDLSGENDGMKVSEYWVKSSADRKNISQMGTITYAAGGELSKGGGEKGRLDAFEKALAGEPQCIVETVWKAECQTCQETAKKKGDKQPRPFKIGMNHFPQTKPGQFDPTVQCPVCKSMVRAQARIVDFFKLGAVKATRGIA